MSQQQSADRARPERFFKAREERKAIADYYAAEQALREQTQKLKRLRLARESQNTIEMHG